MSAILSSFASYFIEMIILMAIGVLGGFIGVKLRKHKDAKAGAVEAEATEAQ